MSKAKAGSSTRPATSSGTRGNIIGTRTAGPFDHHLGVGSGEVDDVDRGLHAKNYLRWFPSLNASWRDAQSHRPHRALLVGRPAQSGAIRPAASRSPTRRITLTPATRITINNAGIKAWQGPQHEGDARILFRPRRLCFCWRISARHR